MEVAVIDWKDSKFVKDDLYEHINAPQWVDFSAPDDPVNDEAWFCRPDCNHPKSVEDFFKRTPNSKLQRSASVSEILPLSGRNGRDAALKKRGLLQPSVLSNKDSKCNNRYVEDSENHNPNLSTPPNHKAKLMKESIKSSTEKKQVDSFLQKEETPRLKSTLSARNLFAGRDILNQITEFCNELKRLATRAKEREGGERDIVKKSPVVAKEVEVKEFSGDNSGVLKERENEREPLLEVRKEKGEETEKSNVKEKLTRKKRNDEAENTPISVNLKSLRPKEEESLLQIRTNPPSPQCFSANRGATKATPPKAFKPRPQERGILQELEQSNKEEVKKDETPIRGNHGKNASTSVVAEKEARTLDVFWFLKPCTLSS